MPGSKPKRSKLDLPKTRAGRTISLDLEERTIFSAIKKAGKKRLLVIEARNLLKFAETTLLKHIEHLRGYGLIDVQRTAGGSVSYGVITRKPGPKPKARRGELRAYQSTLHPRLRVRNDAKFIDGIFETDDLAVQQLLESLSDFNVHIFRVTLEEAQAARLSARAARDHLVEASTVRS